MDFTLMFLFYVISILPNLGNFFVGIAAIGSFVLFISIMYHTLESKRMPKFFKFWLPCIVVFSMLSASMIPSYKQMAFIVGGTWVASSEEVQKLPDNVAKTVNSYLEQLNEDMDEEKSTEK